MTPDLDLVAAIIAEIDNAPMATVDPHKQARAIIDRLVADHGARHRCSQGTYHLRIASVTVTNTAGGGNLLGAWTRKARRLLTEAGR